MDKPKHVHKDAVIRIHRYIEKSSEKGLSFKKNDHFNIEVYYDVDYVGLKADIRSTSGYCTYQGENLVTWRSQKQHIVSRSYAEAKYRVMVHTATEMIGVKNLLKELGFTNNVELLTNCDNQAAI